MDSTKAVHRPGGTGNPDRTNIVTTSHKVSVSSDTPEAEQFVAWLTAQGHEASINKTTGDYINGEWTEHNVEASETMRALWEAYCNS